ncbi:MAG: hypothetical protein ABIJ96_13425 [Elusimicrobiota bacterium]
MPFFRLSAYAFILLGVLPSFGHAVRVVGVQTGGLQGTGSGASGAASAANISQTNITINNTVGVDIGHSSLMKVDNPALSVSPQGGDVVIRNQPGLNVGQPGLSVDNKAVRTTADKELKGGESSAEREGEGGVPKTDLQKLDKATQDIRKTAQLEKEKKVRGGAVASKLDKMFDFNKEKPEVFNAAPAAEGQGGLGKAAVALEGLPDPSIVGVDKAVSKLSALAANADAAQAPFLYKRAIDIARDAKKTAAADELLRKAARRAAKSVTDTGNKAFSSAAQGRTTEALGYTQSVYGWNSLLSSRERPLIGNFNEFKDAVKHVLGQALESPGKTLPSPTVRFAKGKDKNGAQLQAQITLPQEIAGMVAPLPVGFAANLASPETVIAWDDVAALELSGPRLTGSFDLAAQAGFRAFFRAHRRAGSSALKSFWLAARQYAAGAAAGIWQRLRALAVSLLRSLGILSSGAGLTVDAASIETLRAAPSAAVSLPVKAVRTGDRLNLGYELYPVAP